MYIGITSGFVTILLAFGSKTFNNFIQGSELPYFVTLIHINIILALFTIYKRNKLSIIIANQIKTNIYFGDLFNNSGIIVVPVNEYFDTIVDEQIISSNTLHGYFIKHYFDGAQNNLKQQISSSLSHISPVGINTNRNHGNKNKYALGTVAIVSKGEKIFYLVALTRFNDNQRAEVKKSEYQRVLCDLYDFIEQYSQGTKVSLPLIGSGHSGIDLSKQKLLEFMLFSMTLNDKMTLINGLNIILHKSTKNEIDLNKIKYIYNI